MGTQLARLPNTLGVIIMTNHVKFFYALIYHMKSTGFKLADLSL